MKKTREISAEDFQINADLAMMEVDLQNDIIEAARIAGFDLIYHTWNSKNSAAGFPDLVMLHRSGRMVVIECKREKEQPKPKQVEWLERFKKLRRLIWQSQPTGGGLTPEAVAVFVARPSNRQEIFDTLATYASD